MITEKTIKISRCYITLI